MTTVADAARPGNGAIAALSGIKGGREKIVLVSGDNDFGDVRHDVVVVSEASGVDGDAEVDKSLI